ncbi:MAG: outer membrane protein assembly factor BamA [Prevotellaceae bacterium]|jgi:outer membrane protein insertion porin family|nr:outer membrane protein assembly factor BamA [Prevotellaceae bacterium]
MLRKFLLISLLFTVPLLGVAQHMGVSEEQAEADAADNAVESALQNVQQQEEKTVDDTTEIVSEVNLAKDYAAPQKYIIGGVTVSGVKYYNSDQIIGISGLNVGDTVSIPGDAIAQAGKKLWGNGLFSDVKFSATKVVDDKIYLDIYLQERPRIISWDVKGIKKGDKEELTGMLHIRRGAEYSEYFKQNSIGIIERFYLEKGYKNVKVTAATSPDTTVGNGVRLVFEVDRSEKIKVAEMDFEGNQEITSGSLRGAMKEVHRKRWYKFWQSTKYIQDKLDEDKTSIIAYYNEKGYRDAKILGDSIWEISENRVGVKIKLYEGKRYYVRSVEWMGNTKYPSDLLDGILRFKRGDVYDKVTLDKRLNAIEEASISALYMDDGYLFFRIDPTEVRIDGDSVDLEMRISEGKQATISNIFIKGNSKTNEHVIRRELWTRPGDLFNRTLVIRSVRDLAQMGHFDPEKLEPQVSPNPADETVDITFAVEEKPNDQIELSGGWGAGMFVGTVGLILNNFSMGRIFDKAAWRPFPSGDNQQLAIRGQTNGRYYKAISTSFTDPWFGGKKPQSLSVSAYFTDQNTNYCSYGFFQASDQSMKVVGASVGLGQRLKWPDNYFTLYTGVDLQRYILKDWSGGFVFKDGTANNFSLKAILGRNSTDQPIYPRKGSELSFSLQLTPPYSLLNGKKYEPGMKDSERYRWIEYHKWSFRTAWFNAIAGDFVVALKAQFGYLGMYNSKVGTSPFERFDVGGDGMSGYQLYGVETVGLRGYENSALTPNEYASVYDKFTVEMRYPFVLSPQSTIYGLAFVEAGNAWHDLKKFNPFSVKRSAGFGVRLMLPMIGLLGIDWAYGFDAPPGKTEPHGSQIHFIIGTPF